MRVKLLAVLSLAVAGVFTQAQTDHQNTRELQESANRAKSVGDLASEATYLCEAATIDSKRYEKKCSRAKDDSAKALLKFQEYLGIALAELQHKDYEGALRDLQKITFGPNKAEAEAWIQQARIGIGGGIAIDPLSVAAFRAAREDYLHGDFDAAELLVKRVQSPILQNPVNQLLTNIKVYRSTMQQADIMAHNGDLKGAAQQYIFAAKIQQNGPGHPQDRLKEIQAKEAQVEAENTRQAAPVGGISPEKTQQLPQTHTPSTARKRLNAPRQMAAEERAKNDQIVTAAPESGVQQHDIAIDKHSDNDTLDHLKPIDSTLAQGLSCLRKSDFYHAEEAFGKYLQGADNTYAGVAHFYIGVSLLSEALLTYGKEQTKASMLRQQAHNQFVFARQLSYKPKQSIVSPKILTEWAQAGDQ